MKNIKLLAFIACLLTGLCYQAMGQSKQDITQLLIDSKLNFAANQGAATSIPVIEAEGNRTTYYQAKPKYKGEISLLREQERNGVVYKTLIYGWNLSKNTPKDVKMDAETARKAALKIIQEKVATGQYKSYKVKTTDNAMRTELRDSVAGRVLEIVEHKNYFHLIIFGQKWRSDAVDGLTSDFTIEGILGKKD